MATLLQITQFFDNAGTPLTGGFIYATEAGTSTPKNMYADKAETPLGTYYELSASGRVPSTGIWLRGAYKLIIKDSGGTTLYTLDNVEEYDSLDFTGLTATVADLNSTTTTALTKTSTYNVVVGDRGKTILADSTSGNVTINLPAAATAGNKFIIRIKKIDTSGFNVILDGSASEKIDGANTSILQAYLDSVILQCDGSAWHIIARKMRDSIQAISAAKSLALINDIRLFLCDASSGAFDVTLPNPAIVGKSWRVGLKKTDSSTNIVTLKQNSIETIDGQTEIGLGNQYAAVEVITDGTNWYVANEYDDVSDEPYAPLTLNGLKIERDVGDVNHDIKFFSEGAARSAGDNYNINPAAFLIKKIDTSWAEGSNQGGFPTGISLAANTCYHEFWITKPNGVLDAGFDSSLTATNLLADATGYTDYLRVGSIYTDVSLNIEPFLMVVDQNGRTVYYDSPFSVTSGALVPGTHFAQVRAPVGISTNCHFSVGLATITAAGGLLYVGHPLVTTIPLRAITEVIGGQRTSFSTYLDTTPNLKYVLTAPANHNVDIELIGWTE